MTATFLLCLSSFGIVGQSHALQPLPNFFLRVKNATVHKIAICSADLKVCETVNPGGSYVDARATALPKVADLGPWIADTVVKTCNRIIPAQTLIDAPRIVEDWRSLTIHLVSQLQNDFSELADIRRARFFIAFS
ncbi:hypothetical protein [Massilia genomosp. 1]|uniref:Uncharacterized protein n=1 Tax=Massilia genomosp. 1 TaxID=2609280 RepID=A0ABX0MW60_9BURK|nr:hypothetical protein [Massilia genomosp. 1]NHZ66992.1 hypothetical protein [Massilia genomosp. 1]